MLFWLYVAEPVFQRHCRRTKSHLWNPDTLLFCCSRAQQCSHSPYCAEMSRPCESSPDSRTLSCVPACCRSLLHSCLCFCSRRQWKPLHFQPIPPPSNSVLPSQLCTAPGPNWWSDPDGPDRAAAPSAWSLLFGHQRSIDRSLLCSGPGLDH